MLMTGKKNEINENNNTQNSGIQVTFLCIHSSSFEISVETIITNQDTFLSLSYSFLLMATQLL
jgi:hypothetical protein